MVVIMGLGGNFRGGSEGAFKSVPLRPTIDLHLPHH